MIENIREASKSWVIKIMLIFIALSFVSWGGFYYFDDTQRGNNAIVVNENAVSFDEYKNVFYDIKENLREQFKNIPQAETFIKQFNAQQLAIDSLVERTLLRQAALESGIVISDTEVAANIQSLPYFKKEDAFSGQLYLEVLKANNFSAEYFEAQQRDKILLDKIISLLQSSVQITENELRDEYLLEYGKGNASFLKVDPANFVDSIKPTDEQIKEYFDTNKFKFMDAEKRVVEYVQVSTASYLDIVEVDQELVEDYYYENSLKFETKDSVHAKHILLKLPVDATEEVGKALSAKALEIIGEIKQGLSFEEAAKKYSQDTTAENGGDVGSFSRNQMVREFEEAAFALKKGEMTQEPVKTFYGYHIIKVIDNQKGRVKTLDEVQNEIVEVLKEDEAKRAAKRNAKKLLLDAQTDFTAAVEAKDLIVQDLTVTQSKILDDAALELLKGEAFRVGAGEFIDPIESKEGYLIGVVKEIITPQEPSINADLEKQVREQLKTQLAQEKAVQLVEDIKGKVNSGESLAELASQHKLKVYATGLVGKRETIKEVGLNDEASFKNLMFSLNEGESATFVGDESAYVIYLKNSVKIDEKDFVKEKEAYANKILSEKRDFIYKGWIQNVKKKATITVHPALKSENNG